MRRSWPLAQLRLAKSVRGIGSDREALRLRDRLEAEASVLLSGRPMRECVTEDGTSYHLGRKPRTKRAPKPVHVPTAPTATARHHALEARLRAQVYAALAYKPGFGG